MPGNAPFATFYNENLGDKTFRFVTRDANYDTLDLNWDDAVTLVPPRLTPGGYTQVWPFRVLEGWLDNAELRFWTP